MTTSFNASSSLAPGTWIEGKWHHHRYLVERLLGRGANGAVYLVRRGRGTELAALKIGYDAVDLQSEINVLTTLAKHQNKSDRRMRNSASRPFLLDVDDYKLGQMDMQFYVMRYVEGVTLHQYMEKNGPEWMGLIGYRLLQKLVELHEAGYVFGDLKPENIMVSSYGQVELVDYGGVSRIGRSVKQFTERYDRGYWNAGSRAADPGYDLFAFAVLWLHVMDGARLRRQGPDQLPQVRSANDLINLAHTHIRLKSYESWFKRAISGQFASSHEACSEWKQAAIRSGSKISSPPIRRHTPGWLKGIFVASIILLGSTLYIILQSN